jgi:spore maturation protein CgeB
MKLSLSNKPRVLLVGDYMWPWYQEACAKALEIHGCKVDRFGWLDDFWEWVTGRSEPVYRSIFHRLQYRFRLGPTVWKVNKRLIRLAKKNEHDIVWFYNVHLISYATVKKMRAILPNAIFCQYANDNPFSRSGKPGFWKNYLKSINYFDMHFTYRHSNIADYQQYGSTNVNLLRAYFIPEVDFPEPLNVIPERYNCDVVFAGHYEDDGRIQLLEAICKAGYKLNLFGGGWNAALPKLDNDSPLRELYPIEPAVGVEYRYAICGAKVALNLLSTLNRDTYTRRNFQIPAMKTCMLSQYTEDLASLFKSDCEAAFFKNKGELIEKLKELIDNVNYRNSIAEAGFIRVYNDGHSVNDRMHFFLNQVIKNSV